ncbi:hypothetical protein BaRGS_00035282 [Batillaria attramentaria]|uniref:Metalloendopeptidase n=1 Tax=Batillaria attramentaria TaxID=370345 RepID=A0ABD0JES2_9CAEN
MLALQASAILPRTRGCALKELITNDIELGQNTKYPNKRTVPECHSCTRTVVFVIKERTKQTTKPRLSSSTILLDLSLQLNNTFRDDPDLRYLDGDVFDDDTELDEVHVYLKHGVPVRGKKKAQRDPVQGLIPPADVIDDVLDESAEYSYPKSKKDKKSKKSKSETRKKRSITVDPSNYWPNGIVPYVYDDTMTEDLKKSFYFASELIEKYTCVRFVPWDNETRTSYGIDHDNYLLFMGDSNACNSYVGMIDTGSQQIRCCHAAACVHELGHALGFEHEHINYLSEGWLRINRGLVSNARRYKNYRPESGRVFTPYDLSSPMEYAIQTTNGIPEMTVLFPELAITQNYFYMMGDIATMYQCKERNCSTHMDCYYDGYVTLLDGQCACHCVEGRDPATGCQTLLAHGGSYAFPAPLEGCPSGHSLSSGTLEHFFLATRTYQYKENLLQGELSSGRAEHHFCVSETADNDVKWPRGNYCLMRKGGSCPEGTSHGYIQFDNKPSSGTEYVSTWSGTLPDGTYGEDTRWEFCCRDDSVLSVPMDLPNDQPLALWRNSYYGCQPIKGMNSESHMMVLKNDVTGLAQLSPSGTRPLTWKYASGNMYISYCYYYPIQTGSEGCGGVITLTSTERSATFTSPGYPANYENKLHCVWTIEGPPDSSILLTFSDFDVEGTPNNCEDEVEVNHALIGQNGISYCGQEMYGTIRSVTNKMSVKLITGLFGQTGGFNATVTLALPEEHCFNPADRGASYRGTVSFTRDFQTCLPWSEVTHCPHHPYKHGDYYDGLDGNYCRNPGDGLRPWCYTNATFCQRNYCDVCQLENAYDTEDAAFCQDLLVNESCSDHAVARQYCSRTCADLLPAVDIPTTPCKLDTDCVNNGDCSKHQTLEATCLSDGTWTPMGYVCGACLDGWHAFQETCYKVQYEQLSYSDASTKCSNDYEGDLAEWIGLTLDEQTSQWVWQDGSVAQWTNWRTGEPGNYKCASADEYGEWSDVYCANSIGDWERAFTCPRTVCKDRITDCAAILTSYPNVCDDYPDFAYVMCPSTCALCSDAVPPECPENWTEFEEACYKFNSTTASYANAVSACAAEGAVLSPAKSQNEFFFVFQQLGSASAMWLGANDIATEGTWLWEDGTAIDFNKWKTGEPDNVHNSHTNADCLWVLTTGKWRDAPCNWKRAYVCKKPLA